MGGSRSRGEAATQLTRRVSEGERFQTRWIHSRLERPPSLTRFEVALFLVFAPKGQLYVSLGQRPRSEPG